MMGARSRGRETTRVPAPLNRTQSAATVGRINAGQMIILILLSSPSCDHFRLYWSCSECECDAPCPASVRARGQLPLSAALALLQAAGWQADGLHGRRLLLERLGHGGYRGRGGPGDIHEHPQAENSFLQRILFFLLPREPYLIKTKDGKKQTLAEYEKSLVEDYKKRSQLNLSS